MKTLRQLFFAALCAAFFTGCDKDPFAQTETGAGTLGCIINGEPYVCYARGIVPGAQTMTTEYYRTTIVEGYRLWLFAHCYQAPKSPESKGGSISISIYSQTPLLVGEKYYFTADNSEYYANWNWIKANSGHFILRKLERIKTEDGSKVVIAGNFEFEAQSVPENPGETPVKYVCTEGTFDTICETDVL